MAKPVLLGEKASVLEPSRARQQLYLLSLRGLLAPLVRELLLVGLGGALRLLRHVDVLAWPVATWLTVALSTRVHLLRVVYSRAKAPLLLPPLHLVRPLLRPEVVRVVVRLPLLKAAP